MHRRRRLNTNVIVVGICISMLLLFLLGVPPHGQCTAQQVPYTTPVECSASGPTSPGNYHYDGSNIVDSPCTLSINSSDVLIDVVGVVVYLEASSWPLRNVSITVRGLLHATVDGIALVKLGVGLDSVRTASLEEVHVSIRDCVNVTVRSIAMIYLPSAVSWFKNCSFDIFNVTATYERHSAAFDVDGVLFHGASLTQPLGGNECNVTDVMPVEIVARRDRQQLWSSNVSVTIRSVIVWSWDTLVVRNGTSSRIALAAWVHAGLNGTCGGVVGLQVIVEDTAVYICPPPSTPAEASATKAIVAQRCGRSYPTTAVDSSARLHVDVAELISMGLSKVITMDMSVRLCNVTMESWRSPSSRILAVRVGGAANSTYRITNATLVGTSTMSSAQKSLSIMMHTVAATIANISVVVSDSQLIGFVCGGACSWDVADDTSSVMIAALIVSPPKAGDSGASVEQAAITFERCRVYGIVTNGSFSAVFSPGSSSSSGASPSISIVKPFVEGSATIGLCSVTLTCSQLSVQVRSSNVSGQLALAVNETSVAVGLGYAKVTGSVVLLLLPLVTFMSSFELRNSHLKLLGPTRVAESRWNTTMVVSAVATAASDADLARYIEVNTPPLFVAFLINLMVSKGYSLDLKPSMDGISINLTDVSVALSPDDDANFINRTFLRKRGLLSRHQTVSLVAIMNAVVNNMTLLAVNSTSLSGSCVVQPVSASTLSDVTFVLRNVTCGSVVQTAGFDTNVWRNVTLRLEGCTVRFMTPTISSFHDETVIVNDLVAPNAAVYGLGWPGAAASVSMFGSHVSLGGSVFDGFESVLQPRMILTASSAAFSNRVDLRGCNGLRSRKWNSGPVQALRACDNAALGTDVAAEALPWSGVVAPEVEGLSCTAPCGQSASHELGQATASVIAVAVALVALGGGSELQALVALGAGSCTPEPLVGASVAARVALSPFYALGTQWAVAGNVLLSLSVCVVQWVVTRRRQCEYKESLRVALSRAQAPQWSYRAWVLLHVGITRGAVVLLFGGRGDYGSGASVAVGMLGLAWNAAALGLVVLAHTTVLRANPGGELRVRAWGRALIAAVVPRPLWVAVPRERWVPDAARRRYGPLVSAMSGARRHWAMYPMVASSVMGACAAVPWNDVNACVVPWAVGCVVGLVVSVCVGVARPHRIAAMSLQQSASYGVVGLLSGCVACGVTSSVVLDVLSALQVALGITSTAISVFAFVVERLLVLRCGTVLWNDTSSVMRWLAGDTCFAPGMPSSANSGSSLNATVARWLNYLAQNSWHEDDLEIEREQRLSMLLLMICDSNKLNNGEQELTNFGIRSNDDRSSPVNNNTCDISESIRSLCRNNDSVVSSQQLDVSQSFVLHAVLTAAADAAAHKIR